MGYTIPDSAIKLSNRCLFSYKCQDSGNSFRMCEIERAVQNKALLIKKRAKDFCPYCTTYGYNDFCTCPARIAIFQKYKK